MINPVIVLMFFTGLSTVVNASGGDDPLLYKVMVDKLELRDTDGPNPLVLDADVWVGYDLNKLWFKTGVEYADGKAEEAELEFLYSRAIAPFWDFQIGWRRDIEPEPDRDYLAFKFRGLAPYLFDVNAGVFIGESAQLNARVDAEYEYMFTQKLILSPEIELNIYSKDDEAIGIGAGLSDMELGMRLRYEIQREFAPYVGVNWAKKFGQTADFAKDEGENSSEIQLIVGMRIWY